jgi:site-specific recombinase XerD
MSEHYPQNIQSSLTGDRPSNDVIISNFSDHLKKRGHSDGTRYAYQAALMHFICWQNKKSPQAQTIDRVNVTFFLQEHLPVCHCSPPAFKHLKTVRAALNQLLLMQGQKRLQEIDFNCPSAIECRLRHFDNFLRDVCGFAKSTRVYRQRFVRTFLLKLFGAGVIDSAYITPESLIKHVAEEAINLKPSSVGVLLSSLRSYLRFLQFEGESSVSMAAAVPRPPNWLLTTLPPCLSTTELERFLDAFDISTSIGKRDYAMAHCLVDLGLRCHEVAAMKLDDINWYTGFVELPHTKNRRKAQIPLPEITGNAIVNYLRNARPETTSRSLFVFHRAPMGRGVAKTTVRGAIRRAFSRADLPWTGTHILRHTMATRMLQNDVSLKQIADVLRHRSIDTTQIYTKVNLPELRHVAMPWPGRRS